MKIIARAFSLLIIFLTTACAQAGLFAANAPTSLGGVQVSHNVAFGPESWETLDIYVPANAPAKKSSVIVFYYGGRWEEGRKEDYRFVGAALAKKGFVVVIPDYRKYPQVRFPVFVQDAAKSLAWTYDHINAYGGRADRINVAGHSAGAHIGALLTADPRYLKAEGKSRDTVIRRFAGLAGPYDFTPDEDDLRAIFGPPENYPQMQVPTFITGHEPPMLLLYGDADRSVARYNLDKLQNKIASKNGQVQTIIYSGIDHIWIIGALTWFGQGKAPVLNDLATFFASDVEQP